MRLCRKSEQLHQCSGQWRAMATATATAMGNSSISNGNGNNIKRVYTMSDQLICQLLGGTDAYTHTHTRAHNACESSSPCSDPPPAGGHAVAAVTAGQCTAGMPQRLSLSTIAGWPPRYCCGFLFTVFREAQAEKESLHTFRCAPAVIIQYSRMMSGKGRQCDAMFSFCLFVRIVRAA